MSGRTTDVDIIVEEGISTEEEQGIRDFLEQHGLAATVSTTDLEDLRQGISSVLTHFDPGVTGAYRTNGHLWGVLIHARVNEFVQNYGAANLRDAVDGLRRLRAEQTGSSPGKGLVMLIDEDTGIRLDLDFQLPLNAYQDLEGMRFPTFESDPISFHRRSGPGGRWRSPR